MAKCLTLYASFLAALAGVDAAGYIVADLTRTSDQSAYLANFSVGTPPQHVALKVDTGSPTYSFLSSRNSFCNGTNSPCIFGTYDNETSSTAAFVSSGFSDLLIDHGFGDFLNDTVTLGGTSLEPGQFGYLETYGGVPEEVAKPTTTILGLALSCQFSSSADCVVEGASLVQQLRNASAIDRRAVSLYLGPDNHLAKPQMIVGGAYDKAKQGGKPFTVHMVDPFSGALANGQTNSINVTRMSAFTNGSSKVATVDMPLGQPGVGLPTLVDSGSPHMSLPGKLWDVFYDWLGQPNSTNNEVGYYYVDCSKRSSPAAQGTYGKSTTDPYFQLEIGGKANNTIRMPFTSLVSDLGNGTCASFMRDGGEVTNGLAPFGDPFIRNTYITYDFDSFTVTLAQAKYTDVTDIVPIPSNGL